MGNCPVGNCRWAIVGGQLSVGNCRWAIVPGQLDTVHGHPTVKVSTIGYEPADLTVHPPPKKNYRQPVMQSIFSRMYSTVVANAYSKLYCKLGYLTWSRCEHKVNNE